ncbi:MAG: hypothetical protein DMF82_08900 [Acidobacteria bacterium]|nr:MAG: hypothetical protein DMF82_08900 [Acidobacteriota bacterium]
MPRCACATPRPRPCGAWGRRPATPGRDAAAAVPALARAVRDRDGNVRLWAAKALAKIGPPARSALPALAEAARYDSTRAAAEDAIRAIKNP